MTEGLVCVFSIVEPAWSFDVRPDRATHWLVARPRQRKCVHHYLYLVDPELGFMHICVRTWLPYPIQIWVNGREWLARQLDAAGVGYLRHENSLLRIDDLQTASDLCEHFAHRAWPRLLDAFARRVNPLLASVEKADFGGYYWVIDQAEVATDVMFDRRAALQEIWPDLVRHASLNMSSADVVGFLGRKLHPLAQSRGRHRHQGPPRRLAGQASIGPQLDQDLRQGLGPTSRDHHQQPAQSANVRAKVCKVPPEGHRFARRVS